ncbi:MAG: Gfo/Idh/MocA family oxidoreductase [Eubacteriales bacterium]|nr:Gfo/Idh/MocA family oxidoreductase [Eubacteriales bacterium]
MNNRVGVIGCGNIAQVYLEDFEKSYRRQITVAACADIVPEKARETAEKYGVPKACTPEELVRLPEVDIVLNLTVPAVHNSINRMALEAGKHVYCEKPLALSLEDAKVTLDLAKKKGLRVACAPDTILGPAIQTSRKLLDDGWIGTPFAASTNITGWGPETWHPNPGFFYQYGGGPLLDMGPYAVAALVNLFGPMKRMQCIATKALDERMIYSDPRKGERIPVEVPTHYSGSAQMANGVVVGMTMSFDTWKSSLPPLEIYGTEGTLQVPHPADFAGKIRLYRANGIIDELEGRGAVEEKDRWYEIPAILGGSVGNRRGIGVADLAAAIRQGRPHRTGEDFILHCTEILLSFDQAVKDGGAYEFTTVCKRPERMPTGLEIGQVD